VTDTAARPRRRPAQRGRLATAALSLVAHLALLFAFLSVQPPPLTPPEPPPIAVELVAAGPPTPQAQAPPSPAPPAPARPPPRALARRSPPRPDARPVPAGEGKGADEGAELSDAQLAGAATAGAGGQGRACDMVRRLQTALRKDQRIQAAVAEARRGPTGTEAPSGKALFVWNGDWIRSHGQDGAGLAAVREAIMWEVAFAPEACRAEPVHGLVLISLDDGPGSARLVVGAGAWRWSDLLHPRGGG
jgi:hypothetical protein